MPRLLRSWVSLAVVLSVGALCASAQPLPTDSRYVTGELDNGLHYIVRQHSEPPGRAVVWIHIGSGSLNETEVQRGLAHYLEHMAFNGSENFPPGSVVPFFQSLGMTFGRDQNAFTGFDQTTYQLSLPDTKPETLKKGMTFFADILFRLMLQPKEIDAERQIILEERRSNLSGRQRTSFYVLEHMAPGSLFGQRIPIGTEETIKAVAEKDFRDYYGTWYTASNATVMVVADTDPATVVEVLRETFGAAPTKPRPTPQDPQVRAYEKSFAIVASDPEVESETLTIMRIEPARPPTLTVPQYRDDLVADIGQMALNRRLADKVAKGGTSYRSLRVSLGNEAEALYTAELEARANPGQWRDTLKEMALELQRARKFGFSAREIEDVRKDALAGAERAVETEATQPAQAIISRLNGSVSTGEPIMSAQQRLDLLKELLPKITPEEVGQRFAKEFDPQAVAFVAVLPAGKDVPTEAELLQLGTEALQVEPTPEVEQARPTQLMEQTPTGGALKDGSLHEATQVWSGWLNNNVRVHYRFMDERKNSVSVNISLIGGELLETADNRGITSAAQVGWSRPATQKLSSTDIRDLMVGKKIDVRGGGGGGGRGRRGGGGGSADGISLAVSGDPAELETGLQLAYLMLTEPKIEEAAFTQFQTGMREALEEAAKNPLMTGMRLAGALPYPDDEPRAQPLTVEQLDHLKLPAAQAWLDKLIKESPIEVVVIGDMPREAALELVARYLGALAPRPAVSPETYLNLRKLSRPTTPRKLEATVETTTPQAFVLSGFYGADEVNVADARALNMAARILSTRMIKEVREDGQLVYSIGAGARAATTYPGFGVFSAAAPTEPSKVPALLDKLAAMYAAFAQDGPTADELEVARKQTTNGYEEQLREPAFWARRLDQMTFRGVNLDDLAAEPAASLALTAEQIKTVFAKYYAPDKALIAVAKPAE